MEKQYGRLQSRLRICGRENRKSSRQSWNMLKRNTRKTPCSSNRASRGSRSPAVAELAQVQWEYMHKVEDLLKEKAEQFFHCEATSKEEDQAEAALLYAEYAMDFATQAMQYALIVALTAMDLQRKRGRKEGGTNPMKETKKWAAALLAGAAAVGAAAAGVAFWNWKKHNALPAGEAEGAASPAPGRAGGGSPRRGGPW